MFGNLKPERRYGATDDAGAARLAVLGLSVRVGGTLYQMLVIVPM